MGRLTDLKYRLRPLLASRAPAVLAAYHFFNVEWLTFHARRARSRYRTYIGITGSCGKSTTTHLIGRMLGEQARVKTISDQNTTGLVLRGVRDIREPVDYVVQEISGAHPGDIALVTSALTPDVAVVTAVGQDHFANFKSEIVTGESDVKRVGDRYLEQIAKEKGKLVEALGSDGVACLDADKPLVRAMASRTRGRVILFGRSPDAEVRAEDVSAQWPERLAFDLVVGDTRRRVQTRFAGTMALNSMLAALSVVRAVGADLDRAVKTLAESEPYRDRMSVREGTDGHTYILDTTKAPMWQVELLLEDLLSFRSGHLVFVLGEVSDTRNNKSGHYRRLLRRAGDLADHVIGFGPAASNANKVRAEGRENVVGIETYDETVRYLSSLPPSLVILKSNKSAKMWKIWDAVAPED